MSGEAPRKVGIIGVGAMGLGIAARLLGAGYPVLGYRRGDLSALRAFGGEAAASAAAVAREADVVMLLLPSDDALVEVIQSIRSELREGQTVVSLATHRLAAKVAAADLVGAAGAVLLDGEISGTPEMVRAGQASILTAGNPAAAAQVMPVLQAVASSTRHFPRFGDAARVKLLANYLVGVHTLASADAVTMARRMGLEPVAAVEALAASAGASRMLAVRGPMMAAGQIGFGDLTGFLRYFDLLREALPGDEGQAGALFDATAAAYRRAVAAGLGDRDLAIVHDLLATGPDGRGEGFAS